MNGTEDPFIPYNGGKVTPKLFPVLERFRKKPYGHGECTSTDEALALWLKRNGLQDKQVRIEKLPDRDPNDGCTVEKRLWTGGNEETAVILYRVNGGGHTIPDGKQYLPERIVGKTCRDFKGWQAVWQFFEKYPRRPGS